MADKLEVLPGPGLVARFAEVEVWAGPQATPLLLSHLVSEAQRASQTPGGGDQLANGLIAILQRGDPEPQAPFAVVGPGAAGLTLFLHGPVQAWDSGRWLAPQPVPGWMVTSIGRPWPLIVLPYGSHPPPQSQQGNPLDLVTGAVPGSGFVLLRPPGPSAPTVGVFQSAGAPQTAPPGYGPSAAVPQPAQPGYGPSAAVPQPAQPGYGPSAGVPQPAQPGYGAPAGSGPAPWSPSAGGPMAGGPMAGGPGGLAGPQQAYPGTPAPGIPVLTPSSIAPTAIASPVQAPSVTPPAPAVNPPTGGAQGPVDLRNAAPTGTAPLRLASNPVGFVADQPDVPGVRCDQGHFNRPGVPTCLHCGRPIAPGTAQLNGPRPSIGALLADDGSVWALSRGCLIGAEPGAATEVQLGTLQPIAMRSGPNHTMSPVHAEVQLRGWSAYVVDRGAEGGTWLQAPGAQGWAQLGRNEQRELANGSHLSCGGRVLTFLAAWPA